MKSRTLLPNDTRDFLSIISFLGFLAISLRFLADISWLDENLTDFFLIFMGFSLIIVGQLFTFKKWAKDGIQGGEIGKILLIIVGLASIILGFLLLLEINISEVFYGIIGIIGVASAIFIVLDYI